MKNICHLRKKAVTVFVALSILFMLSPTVFAVVTVNRTNSSYSDKALIHGGL